MDGDAAPLESAGFRSVSGGEVILFGPAARLGEAWLRYLSRLLRPFADDRIEAPLFLSRRVLEDAGYLRHFPQHPFRCGDLVDGEERYVTPAACFHIYPSLSGRDLDRRPAAALVLARCARYENGHWTLPFRLASFQMLELVVAGERDTVARRRDEVGRLLTAAFGLLGLGGGFAPATDAFFLGNDEGALLIQKLKGLKREFVVPWGDGGVAVASINDHEDYFARRFDLSGGHDGECASSFCAAFGIERLTAYGLLVWGAEAADWPEELKR